MNRASLPLAIAAITLMSLPLAETDAEDLSDAHQAAMAMVDVAVAHVESDGIMEVITAVSTGDSRYLDGDLYLFVLAENGMVLGHPVRPDLVGASSSEVLDENGDEFLADMAATAMENPNGVWFDYRWTTPDGEVGNKSSWLRTFDRYVLGAGVVTPD